MITFDFETRSEADLTKVGAWAYSEHPSTDMICFAYGIDHEPVKGFTFKDMGTFGTLHNMPEDLIWALETGHEIEAHNVAFERSIWANVMKRKYGWYIPEPKQWRDTMAVAAYYSMPMALDKLARALGFPGKNADGGRLITKYSKLNLKTSKRVIPDDDLAKFLQYCIDDVELEQAVSDELGDLPDDEIEVFLLDQKINMRGLYLNQQGIDAATDVVDKRSAALVDEFVAMTGLKPTQHDKVKQWFLENGLPLDNMQKDYLQELLDDEDDPVPQGDVRRALEIRLENNKASTKKLDAMSRQRGSDGRARFQVRYHGAGTGRWTGSGFQPLNLNRGFENVPPAQLIRDIMHRDPGFLDIMYGDAMDAVSKASRHWIQAQEGSRILAGDFVSVEAVILACLAGEDWKVDAFANGVKIYEMMADKIYGLAPGTVTKATHPTERQDGKTGELAFGYQGALNAWLKFDNSGRHTDERIIEICKAWRAEHPMIVRFWKELEAAAIAAVVRPGVEFGYRDIGFEVIDDWLSMVGPTGKRIWYYKPQLRQARPQWHKPKEDEACATGECKCGYRTQLTYMAQKEGQWKRVSTYGGKLAENATQKESREVLVPAMLRAEAHGYPIILSVYDEIAAEVPNGQGSLKEFLEIMAERPKHALDWPISVDGWEGPVYKK